MRFENATFRKKQSIIEEKDRRSEPLPSPNEGLALSVKNAREMNKTLVMLERLQSPVIQKQLRDVAETYRHFLAKSPDLILEDINKKIEEERSLTHIMPNTPTSLSHYMPLTGKAKIGTKAGGKFSTPQAREYVEAHEKGHAIRLPMLLHMPGLSRRMAKGFSMWSYLKSKGTQVVFASSIAYLLVRFFGPMTGLGYFTAKMLQPSYARSSWEMYERMSQLKNYFGFKGNEQFTEAHLKYARQHYIKDTGVDNNMKGFFKSITPKTEPEFLHIINNFGV